MKKWTVLSADESAVNKILGSTDLAPLTAHVMAARGYKTVEALQEFFNSYELSSPFLLADMQKAVSAIYEAIEQGETICVYGDYDCDGITASSIVYNYLLNMGADVICYIPERQEGYGLNTAAIDTIKENGARLIVTVDNGISAFKEAEYIKSLGLKLVITDHHQPQDTLPTALAVVNPHRADNGECFKDLAGVGVALKLLAALDDGNYDMVLEQYGDIVALGTVADVVPLISENRIIVKKGLELLKNTENEGLIALMAEAGVNPEKLSATTLGFSLAPRINASGRFGSPITAFDCLTDEEGNAPTYACELCRLNDTRKKAEGEIYAQISAKILENPEILNNRVLVIHGEGWHHGVIGIVASRLLEATGKPTVLLSSDGGGLAKGSARSVKGFNIFKCFEACSEHLEKYGGHECAGGLTLKISEIESFNSAVQAYAKTAMPEMPRLVLTADKLLKPTDLSAESIKDLKRLEPFGAENPEPMFAISGAQILNIYPLKNGEHTKLDLQFGTARLQALMFGQKTLELAYRQGSAVDLMGHLGVSEFRGKTSIVLTVCDIRPHGIRQESIFAGADSYACFKRGESLPKAYLQKGLPTRDELVLLYKHLSETVALSAEELAVASGVNSFKSAVALDAFCETGLAARCGIGLSAKAVKVTQKADISSSPTLKKLQNLL